MDKVEYRELIRSIKNKYLESDYEGVIELADELELSKIRENSILEIIAKAYESLGRYDLAKDALLIAYKRTPTGKRIAYNLTILSIKLDDLDSAVMFYEDFCQMAPKDNQRLLLKYEIGRAGGIPIQELIKVLEIYNEREMDDRWEYELARLYHEAGDGEKCAEACDQIILWYANGEYEKKALELKNMHKSLTPSQQARYEEIMAEVLADTTGVRSVSAPVMTKAEEQPAEEVPADEQAQELAAADEVPADEQPQEPAEEEAPADEQPQELTEEEAPADEQPQELTEEAPVPEAVEEQPSVGAYTEETEHEEDEDHIAGQLSLSAMLEAFQTQSNEDKEQSDKVGEDRAAKILAEVNDSHVPTVLEPFDEEPEQDEHLEEVIEPEVPLLNREDTITPVDDGGTDLGERAAEFAFEKEHKSQSSEKEEQKEPVPQVEKSVDATQFIPVNQIAARIAQAKQEQQEKLDVKPAVVNENPVYEEIDPGSAAGRVSVGSAADPGFSMEELFGLMQDEEKPEPEHVEEPQTAQAAGEEEAPEADAEKETEAETKARTDAAEEKAPEFQLDLIFGNNVAPVIKKRKSAPPVKEPEAAAEQDVNAAMEEPAAVQEAEENTAEPEVNEKVAAAETEIEAETEASEPEADDELAEEVPESVSEKKGSPVFEETEEELDAASEDIPAEEAEKDEEELDVEIVETVGLREVREYDEEEVEDYDLEDDDSQKNSWKEALSSAGSKLRWSLFGKKKVQEELQEDQDDLEEPEYADEIEEEAADRNMAEEEAEYDDEYFSESEDEEPEVTGRKKGKRGGFFKSLLEKLPHKEESDEEYPEDEEYPDDSEYPDDNVYPDEEAYPEEEAAEEEPEIIVVSEKSKATEAIAEPEVPGAEGEPAAEAEPVVEPEIAAAVAAAAEVITEPKVTAAEGESVAEAEPVVEPEIEAAAEEEPEIEVVTEEPEAAEDQAEPEIEVVTEEPQAAEASAEIPGTQETPENVFEEDEERFEAYISLEDYIVDPELNARTVPEAEEAGKESESDGRIRRGNKEQMTKAVPEIFDDEHQDSDVEEEELSPLEKARMERAQMKEQKKAAKMALKAQKQAIKAQKIREKAQRLAQEQEARAKQEAEEKAAMEAEAQKEAEEREALARQAAEEQAAIEASVQEQTQEPIQEQLQQQEAVTEENHGEDLLIMAGAAAATVAAASAVQSETEVQETQAALEALAAKEAEEQAAREAAEKAAREAEEQAAREAAEKAAREAAEKAAREAEEQAAREAAEKAAREAEEQAAREAAEKAAREAEEQAAREAAEKAASEENHGQDVLIMAGATAATVAAASAVQSETESQEALEARKAALEAQAALEAEERAAREAEERAAREAQERAAREAEERAAKEAQERAAREAEERAAKEAEERAAKEAEERAEREAQEQARQEALVRAALEVRARQEAQKRAAQEQADQKKKASESALDLDELLEETIKEGPMTETELDALLVTSIRPDSDTDSGKKKSRPQKELKVTESGEFDLDDFIRQDNKKKETRQMSFDDLFGGEFRPKVHIPDSLQTAQGTKTLEVSQKYKLSHEQRKALGEFLLIEGMEAEIEDAIENLIIRKKSGDDTGGHMIVTGDAKSGKTFLIVEILKAVNQEIGHGNPRVAKVQAQAINGKSIRKVLEKVAGSDLIIENIAKLEDDTIRELITSVRENNASTMVILEGTALAVENMIMKYPDIAKVFKTRVDIGELTLTQWSDLAQRYAKGQGYYIDPEALLALHARIDEISTSDMRLGLSEVKKLVDDAIEKAEKQKTGKLFSAFSKKSDGSLIPLTEENFM